MQPGPQLQMREKRDRIKSLRLSGDGVRLADAGDRAPASKSWLLGSSTTLVTHHLWQILEASRA